MEKKPTYEQAQLNLQLYDLRREARLRQARDWYFKNYHPRTFDDAMRIAPHGTEEGTFVFMVFGYWEQACALLNYGLLHEDLFFDTSGEFFAVWEQVKDILPEGRKRFSDPTFLSSLERAAARFETWIENRAPGHLAAMREYMRQEQAAAAKAR
ncbi:MAG: hypothetical protein ABFD60_13025 [Bryobacteraceae bacterium]